MNRPSKWSLVSGASKGIGKATARLLAQNGWGVVLVARNRSELKKLSEYISAQGGSVHWVSMDLTRAQDLSRLVDSIKNWKIDLQALVLNAAIAHIGPILSMPLDQWRAVFEMNVLSQVALLQALFPLLKRPAHIVFMNSVAGKEAFAQWGAYAASKFALRAVADALRAELAGQDIKVTSIFPSSTDTPLQDALGLDWDRAQMLRPESVAQAVWTALNAPEEALVKEIVVEHAKGLF